MQSITGSHPEQDQLLESDSQFDCNICFALASDPVVTLCGHLYCWPCLYKWIQRHKSCPMCSDFVDEDRVIPIFCRDSSTPTPPDSSVPPRPAGLRLLMPRAVSTSSDTGGPHRHSTRQPRTLPAFFALLTNANQWQLSPEFQRLLQPLLFFCGSLLILILLLW